MTPSQNVLSFDVYAVGRQLTTLINKRAAGEPISLQEAADCLVPLVNSITVNCGAAIEKIEAENEVRFRQETRYQIARKCKTLVQKRFKLRAEPQELESEQLAIPGLNLDTEEANDKQLSFISLEPSPHGTHINKNNASGYNNVSQLPSGKWRAYVWTDSVPEVKGNQLLLGHWETEDQAAYAADIGAILLYGLSAQRLNFPELRMETFAVVFGYPALCLVSDNE